MVRNARQRRQLIGLENSEFSPVSCRPSHVSVSLRGRAAEGVIPLQLDHRKIARASEMEKGPVK